MDIRSTNLIFDDFGDIINDKHDSDQGVLISDRFLNGIGNYSLDKEEQEQTKEDEQHKVYLRKLEKMHIVNDLLNLTDTDKEGLFGKSKQTSGMRQKNWSNLAEKYRKFGISVKNGVQLRVGSFLMFCILIGFKKAINVYIFR